MERTVFDVPKMYADHHVLAVREALSQLQGVTDIYASSAFKKVAVAYDPDVVNVAALQTALDKAGYTVGDEWKLPTIPEGKQDNSAWFQKIRRVTSTSLADLEASGDFRRY